MRFLIIISGLFFLNMQLTAQVTNPDRETSSDKVKFSVIQQVAIIGNEVQAIPAFQVIFGAQYKRYFLGVGAAIDPYFTYSFPLFVDGRYTFFDKRFSSYVYGDLGINKMVHSSERFPREWENGTHAYTLHTGLYYDYGLGIKTKLARSLYYTFSIGISFKETKYSYSNQWWGPTPQEELYRNVASRFAVKMGLQF